MLPEPYFQDDLTTLYHGDSRDILPLLQGEYAVITDPVWPNAPAGMFPGLPAPYSLFKQLVEASMPVAKRYVIVLGCMSDPRFLSVIPDTMPFVRVMDLNYSVPGFADRCVITGDKAYVFGNIPADMKPGKKIIPGRCDINISNDKGKIHHPCPRRIRHMWWLVKWLGYDYPVLDFCAGSGTTLIACRRMGYKSVGIELEEKYCRETVRRIKAMPPELDFKKEATT